VSSFRNRTDPRRKAFLALSSAIESQLRDLYVTQFSKGRLNQASVAAALGVNRSVINRRLNGGDNMTEKTIADMVWALGGCIDVDIYDPDSRPGNNSAMRGRDLPKRENINVKVGRWGTNNPTKNVITSVATVE
jgi:hypothetical protein